MELNNKVTEKDIQKDNYIAKYLKKLDNQEITYTKMFINIIIKEPQ